MANMSSEYVFNRNRLRLIQKYEFLNIEQHMAKISPGFFTWLSFTVDLGLGLQEGLSRLLLFIDRVTPEGGHICRQEAVRIRTT